MEPVRAGKAKVQVWREGQKTRPDRERDASLGRGRGQAHGQKEGEPVVLSLLSANSSFPGRGRQERAPAQLRI